MDTAFLSSVPVAGEYSLLMRVVNPMENGLPVRFSNAGQDEVLEGYVCLGKVSVFL